MPSMVPREPFLTTVSQEPIDVRAFTQGRIQRLPVRIRLGFLQGN